MDSLIGLLPSLTKSRTSPASFSKAEMSATPCNAPFLFASITHPLRPDDEPKSHADRLTRVHSNASVFSLGAARHETASFVQIIFDQSEEASYDALAQITPKDNPIQFVCSMGSRGFFAGRGACVYCEACARLTDDDSLPS